MAWPVDDITTTSVDSNTDRPNRGHFFTLFRRVKELIAARGAAGGVAALDNTGKVPVAQLPDSALQGQNLGRGAPNGVASLDANGDVPIGQIPNGIARLAGPNLTGTPTAPTQQAANRSTRIATTAFVGSAIDSRLAAVEQRLQTIETRLNSFGGG